MAEISGWAGEQWAGAVSSMLRRISREFKGNVNGAQLKLAATESTAKSKTPA